MKPEFSKPFNLEHARAGAPFCGIDGEAVRILIWDRKHPTHPIIAIEERGEQEAIAFRADGKAANHPSLGIVFELVMLPLGFIDGKPVFVGDKFTHRDGEEVTAAPMDIKLGFDGAHWPVPAKEYPTFDGSVDTLAIVYSQNNNFVESLIRVANAALRHAIDAGQVVPVSEAQPGLRPHNPYTGQLRDPHDIESDPIGVLIRHPDEPLRSAAPYAT